MVVACIALVVSILSLGTQRKHDRLSVRPIADFQVADDGRTGKTVRVILRNVGLGPMLISEMWCESRCQVQVKTVMPHGGGVITKRIECNESNSRCSKSLFDFLPQGEDLDWFTDVWDRDLHMPKAILPGEGVCIFDFSEQSASAFLPRKRPDLGVVVWESIRLGLSKVSLEIVFENVYGDISRLKFSLADVYNEHDPLNSSSSVHDRVPDIPLI